MRQSGLFPFLIAGVGLILFSGYRVGSGPQAHSDGNAIVVSWSMADESDVQYYEVMRKAGQDGDFSVISPQIRKKGNNSTYEFRDLSVFKTEDGLYYYKIRSVTGQYPVPETAVASAPFVSSTAKRTWGSIKAMFR
jgi:hypothetical protein